MTVDGEKLLEHIAKVQRITHSGVVLAFADGLEARIRRGDFAPEQVQS